MKIVQYIILLSCCLSICYLFKVNSDKSISLSLLSKAIKNQNIVKKDSLVNIIEQERFKEDFYSTQLSIQSDWSILYVTLIFGLFGFLSYSFFIEKTNSIENTLRLEISEHKKEYQQQKKELLEMKKDFYLLSATYYFDDAKILKRGVMKFNGYLSAAYNYLKAIELENDQEQINVLKPVLISALRACLSMTKTLNKNSKSNIDEINVFFDVIQEKIFEINNFNNVESRSLCANIIVELNGFRK